jgi:[ribosomal protein S5]-alanine N-acetyltransferase
VTEPSSDGHAAWQGDACQRTLETVLDTPRLVLEPLQARHADELWAPLSDPRLYEYVPGDPPASQAALRERFTLLSARRSPKGDQLWLNWVMRARSDGLARGRLEATVLPNGSAWIAYEVFVAHWRQGYATEGCRRMIGWLIDELGVQRVGAEVDSLNDASLRLLARLGFQRAQYRENADTFKGRTSHEWTLRLEADRFRQAEREATASRASAAPSGGQ